MSEPKNEHDNANEMETEPEDEPMIEPIECSQEQLDEIVEQVKADAQVIVEHRASGKPGLGPLIHDYNDKRKQMEGMALFLQVELDVDPFLADRDLDGNVIFSGKVINAEGEDVFGVTCTACNLDIPEGDVRYHSVDHRKLDLCEGCFDTKAEVEGLDFDAHVLVKETEHPIWMHIGVRGCCAAESMHKALLTYAERPCLMTRNENEFVTYSYREVHQMSNQLAEGLRRRLDAKSIVGICGPNSMEWFCADLAVAFNHFVTIGLHMTYSHQEVPELVKDLCLDAVLCVGGQVDKFVEAARRNETKLKLIVVLDDEDVQVGEIVEGLEVVTLASVLGESDPESAYVPPEEFVTCSEHGGIINVESDDPMADKLFTVMMTSGSTGKPKGVMVSDACWHFDIGHALYLSPLVTISYIPLSHSTDRMRIHEALLNGGRVGFGRYNSTGTGVNDLIEDAAEVAPSVFIAPPRVWNTLFAMFKKQFPSVDRSNETTYGTALKEFQQVIGGRVAICATGGAPTPKDVMEFMRDCWGEEAVHESYGTTECGGIFLDNQLMDDVEVKIQKIEGLDLADDRIGEICVKSKTVFPGYFDAKEATEKATDDEGWYRTGDLGFFDEDNKLFITGRVKTTTKNAMGEYYNAPELEQLFSQVPGVDQICIHGDEQQNVVVAIVVPSSAETDVDSQQLHDQILASMQQLGEEHEKKAFEIPADVIVSHEEWTADNGFLTVSLKVKRAVVADKFREEINKVFERVGQEAIDQ